MKPLTIAVDMDGTTSEFVDGLRQHAVTMGYPPEQVAPAPTQWHHHADWQMTPEEWRDVFHDAVVRGDIWADPEPVPGAIDGINALAAAGHRIVVVTARTGFGVEKRTTTETAAWLDRHGIRHEGLHVTGEKTSVPWDLLVDDAEHNVNAAIRAGRQACLFGGTWNTTAEHQRWTWAEIVGYFT